MTLRAVIWCAVSTKEQAESDRDSLPSQERDGIAICEREGWRVVAVLKVPGHSRNYIDIHECAADMRKVGIDALDRLLDLWDRQEFDVLICRDGDRFARSQSLHAYIVERTIKVKARIYSMADGWIDEQNFRMFIAMGGYRAAGANDERKKLTRTGVMSRVSRGLNANNVAFGFILERDPHTGKGIALHHDLTKRRMLDDLAELFLAGVSWKLMAIELYERYGHVNPDTGRLYSDRQLWKILNNPYTWGHTAFGFDGNWGSWVYDASEPLPAGVEVHRDIHEPLYAGDLAEQIRVELRRRKQLYGHASPTKSYRFSGLMVCAECGYTLVLNRSRGGYRRYRCNTRYTARNEPIECTQQRTIATEDVQEYVHALLTVAIENGDASLLQPAGLKNAAQGIADKLAALEREIDKIKGEIAKLALKQLSARPGVQDVYQGLIDQAGERLDILQHNAAELRSKQLSPDVSRSQQTALERLAILTVETLWTLPDREIHQILHAVFGETRIVVRDDECIGLTRDKRKKGNGWKRSRGNDVL